MASKTPSSSSSRRPRNVGVGSFTINEEIGKGSFATVYRGTHVPSGSLVAIKSVNLGRLNKKLKDNLYVEIEILKSLHHPHIVALMDCRESTSHIHLMMEYCELGDLSYFIKKRDKLADNPSLSDMIGKYPMPVDGGLNQVVVRHFFKQLSSAMQFLRDRDFVHRDVKPQNLLLIPSPDWMAKRQSGPEAMKASKESIVPMVGINSLPMLKLADFGFARSLPSTSLAETLCGSPLYMAPEILRYEKYDARADLWSIGTVLYEMMTGKPPFRAANHVELLRKIEQNEDDIRFPSKAVFSRDLKDIARRFLKKRPEDRITFPEYFAHPVVTGPIPGLVGEDLPKEIITPLRSPEASIARHPSLRERQRENPTPKPVETTYESLIARDIGEQAPKSPHIDANQPVETTGHKSGRPGSRDRPSPISAATAPNVDTLPRQRDRTERHYAPTARPVSRKPSYDEQANLPVQGEIRSSDSITEAEQDVRDAREYVLVEKKAVEVNAFADEMAASPRLAHANHIPKQPTRRHTSMGAPNSTSGAVAVPPSRAVQKAQGNIRPDTSSARNSYGSYGKTGSSPSTASAIAKALQGASVRVFGVSWSPTLIGKGPSPQQLYNPYPAYPTPNTGLIGDARPIDEDQRVVNVIEDSATRSDVVYGFAEVKYRQLIPLAPSMNHGLGGPNNEKVGDAMDEDDGLTVEAIVNLSEEALVLYVKSLSLLSMSMDIAGAWWMRKNRGGVISGGHTPGSDSSSAVQAGNRINGAVQWVRTRFNEVLEKAELVRLKLVEAQKRLPEDHPGHPSNHATASKIVGGSSTTDGVVLSSGITAEKLMYDRALEMSRTAAINELANEDLPGCEISYTTAIRMLEAVLENDEEFISRKRSPSLREDKEKCDGGEVNGINFGDRKDVLKVLQMIRTRLHVLKKKMAVIARHQSMPPLSSPRHSHSGGTTPTIANTPPH
ncbi:166285f2-4ee7-4885-8b2e-ac349fd364bf [Sclerotinia trifoliorum]|uniref:Serine/threonine-protein kinase ATG1 n=1 Tax=Sclerotinia trifoliorum TaxID=28548 RepID=A0A8H2ZNS9_9HELO|nr:166285f2-4ee7-4885-8b2e-ac349fd364bf [Sclerotinia trifoliorum]